MRILSYNVRGFGSRVKKKEIKDMIRKHKVELHCIQQTKTEVISDFLYKLSGVDGRYEWMYRPFDGRSGGIFPIWDSEVFSSLSLWHMHGAVIVNYLWV